MIKHDSSPLTVNYSLYDKIEMSTVRSTKLQGHVYHTYLNHIAGFTLQNTYCLTMEFTVTHSELMQEVDQSEV